METMTLGERLEQIKYEKKLNNSQLGEIAGVSGTQIANIIKGETKEPKLTFFQNISNRLQINLSWLMGKSEIMTAMEAPLKYSPKEESETMKEFRQIRNMIAHGNDKELSESVIKGLFIAMFHVLEGKETEIVRLEQQVQAYKEYFDEIKKNS